jgi:hypothetical protein
VSVRFFVRVKGIGGVLIPINAGLSARPIPRIIFPKVEEKDGIAQEHLSLTGITFTNPPPPSLPIQPDRPLNIVLALSSQRIDGGATTTRLVRYELSKRNVQLSTAFGMLGSPTLSGKGKMDLINAGRPEWVSRMRLFTKCLTRLRPYGSIDLEGT